MLAALVQAVLVAAAAQDRQRAADLAAAEGAAMYRFLADNAMDLITRHSSDGRIRFASPAAQRAAGPGAGTRSEGVAPSALVHPDDLQRDAGRLHGSGLFRPRRRRRSAPAPRDGHYVWAEIRCRPAAPRRKGEAADIVAVTRDISERKAQERALIEARDAAKSASPRQDPPSWPI